jgi:hypothetical protein
MRHPHAGDRAGDLRGDVHAGDRPRQLAAQRESKAHGRIEMRAGQRPEGQDQNHENGPGRQGVTQQGERPVTTRELRGHDAGADDGREQERRSQTFRKSALR